jgi:hypothetical protein
MHQLNRVTMAEMRRTVAPGAALAFEALTVAKRVVEENFVFTHMDSNWR